MRTRSAIEEEAKRSITSHYPQLMVELLLDIRDLQEKQLKELKKRPKAVKNK